MALSAAQQSRGGVNVVVVRILTETLPDADEYWLQQTVAFVTEYWYLQTLFLDVSCTSVVTVAIFFDSFASSLGGLEDF